MELFVKLFEEDALLERPSGGFTHCVDIPAFGDNLVFDDPRVADERVDAIAGHHRH